MTKRLVLSYLVITVLVLLLLEVPLAVFYAQRERDRVASGLEHDANVVASVYEDSLENKQPPARAPADRYAARTGARVVVVDQSGSSLVDTGGTTGRDFSTRPEIAQALAGSESSGTRRSTTLDTDLLYVAVPIASAGNVYGAIRLSLDTSAVDARIHRFWLALVGVAVAVLGAVALVGWVLARSVTRPVRRLNAAAGRFARGDLRVSDDLSGAGPPELRMLDESMITMARRLDDTLAAQRTFVADASHQLRTPLTALRLRLENLQSRLQGLEEDELDAAIDETSRLSELVNDLLQLARAAETRGITLRTRGSDRHLFVAAVPGAIEQILDNLLDNAVTAAPSGSVVTVEIGADTLAHTLTISDEGPGLDAEQKANATRRFWRGDASEPGTGLGLGLAIVSALAAASGGGLRIDDAPGGGLAVRVTFPAERPPEPTPSVRGRSSSR